MNDELIILWLKKNYFASRDSPYDISIVPIFENFLNHSKKNIRTKISNYLRRKKSFTLFFFFEVRDSGLPKVWNLFDERRLDFTEKKSLNLRSKTILKFSLIIA